MNWLPFVAAFGIFFLTHSLPVRPKVKSLLVSKLGPRGFTIVYSILSLGMIIWLVAAAGNAPFVLLWDQAPWQRYTIFVGMLLVCLLFALTIARPNPFSFGGFHNERFDPHRPGLIRWIRHPMLLALAGWSALHLLPNGDLAHTILFGVFAVFALAGMAIIDRRKQRLLGKLEWVSLHQTVASAPLISMQGSWAGYWLRIAASVLGFTLLLILHPVVLGVSPLP